MNETDTTQINENSLSQIIDEWIEIWNTVKEKKKNQKLSKCKGLDPRLVSGFALEVLKFRSLRTVYALARAI